jgi:hypothetical protein
MGDLPPRLGSLVLPEGRLGLTGQVPLHPEQPKGDALASATTSRTLINDTCSAQHEAGGAPATPSHSQNRLYLMRWATSLIIG